MCSIFCITDKSVDKAAVETAFDKTISRGPDMTVFEETKGGYIGFHRLAIMGLNASGMQPFYYKDNICICNGELYGFRKQKAELENKGYKFKSESDCEILLPMYELYGLDMFRRLDAEFACVIYDGEKDAYIAARDPIGIRPLYYVILDSGAAAFASEPKNLVGLSQNQILPFPPGHYYYDGKFVCYRDVTKVDTAVFDVDTACAGIKEKLIAGIEKRLDADAPLGFLLSGGLDSSLVCAVGQRLSKKKIRTFAVGMDKDAIDLKYARQVARYIGADHTEIFMTRNEVIAALDEVIAALGTPLDL